MTDSKYKLTYFNVKGLGEAVRFIFAYADVEFEDFRIAKADWPAFKDKQPFGSLPVLDVDGKILNQSVCICRYLGKKFGLTAEDPFTDALLEALVDNLREIQPKIKNEIVKKTPESMKECDAIFKYTLDRFEPVAWEGYFYGSKPTWVDIYFTGMMEAIAEYRDGLLENYPNLQNICRKIKDKDGIKNYIKQRPAPEMVV